jgi:threonyl-tRNA synthetase
VIGDKEVESETITLESRDSETSEQLTVDALVAKLSTEVDV